jgi:uncharacterized protein YcgL (UPF0745 family)
MSETKSYGLRLCAVYKSPKKAQTYLYVTKKDDLSRVPAALLETFGVPIFSMMLPLKKERKLAQVDSELLWLALQEKGYYLQLSPPEENLLKIHLQQQNNPE